MSKLRYLSVPLNQVLWIRGQPCEIIGRRSILHNGGANTLIKVKWGRHLIEEIAVT
ncbi:MAG TPA: hypothetical protein VFU31_21175 [Candidatus Binatia bacterium]|nr:hypothetical protein [Candidatus Binatia bacterium]